MSNLLEPMPAFPNGASYDHWQENNCYDGCKWAVDLEEAFNNDKLFPLIICPIQKAFDRASLGEGLVRPWILHVSGAGMDGKCKAKEREE
jgi:hypothetical protein